MTSAAKIASILKKLGDAHYQAADELLAIASDSATAPVSAAGPAAADSPPAAPASFFADGIPVPEQWDEFTAAKVLPKQPEPTGPQGHEAICPRHRKEYREGQYGAFCTSKVDADDPWGKRNKKGDWFCAITPKNAHKWLTMQAAAA